jgi:hypothetical protein
MGYTGSEEFIRLQFEEYLLALLASTKYRLYLQKHKGDDNAILTDYGEYLMIGVYIKDRVADLFVDGDPSAEFNSDWIEAWMRTENYRIFNKITDSLLFDITDAKHPFSGGLSIEDVQRRLAQSVLPCSHDVFIH